MDLQLLEKLLRVSAKADEPRFSDLYEKAYLCSDEDRNLIRDPEHKPVFEVLCRFIWELRRPLREAKENEKRGKERELALQEENMRLTMKEKELERLRTDYKDAHDNLQRLVRPMVSKRDSLIAELDNIEEQLKVAGAPQISTTSKWLGPLVATMFAVLLAMLLIYIAVSWTSKPLSPSLEVTYDLGKIIEALLLGSGALVAGVAYAISTFRKRG